jgi:lipopolysaccharide/colanic/teichoic acid biosynthesis glycosyltransferase
MGKQGSFIKRLTDIIISIIVLLITSPIILIAIAAVKLNSKGHAFFIHERTGLYGKSFRMIKFRGMIDNALAHGPVLTQVNDPRLTSVGKFLRRTSIDELPQFINVLKGEMSVIGPRPEMIELTKDYSEEDRKVFNFKPGITGYSQVNGRQMLSSSERSKMEIEYYAKADFWSDFKIVIKTFSVILTNEGNV